MNSNGNEQSPSATIPHMDTESGEVKCDAWRRYYPPDLVDWMLATVQSVALESGGVRLNIDLYERPESGAPVFIFNHGGGGYSRMFGVLARELHGRGFTVALPDQRGQGLSAGDRGDFTIPELVKNISDAYRHLRGRFAGPMVLAGGSIGGALTYMAAATLARENRDSALVAVSPPDAVICHNLFDLGRARDALGLSRLHRLRGLPGFAATNRLLLRICARIAPGLRLPFGLLGNFRAMVDERDQGFYRLWKNDPLPIKRVSLRYLASVGTSPPAIPFEENELPLLVLNPVCDRMTPPAITRANYERLGGPKYYRELSHAHWSVSESFAREWCDTVEEFLGERGLTGR